MRDREHVQVAGEVRAIPLQRAKVIGVTKLPTQRLEDVPVSLLSVVPDFFLEMRAQIRGDGIVIEQRVVDVEQDHQFLVHRFASLLTGLPSRSRASVDTDEAWRLRR